MTRKQHVTRRTNYKPAATNWVEVWRAGGIGLAGYLLGTITSPVWAHLGESLRDLIFYSAEPELKFSVQSGDPTIGLTLLVENTGGKPATIGSLTVEFCRQSVTALVDTFVSGRHRPTVSWDGATEELRQRLLGTGDNEWAPNCVDDRVSAVLIPTPSTVEVGLGQHPVQFQPDVGFKIKGTQGFGSFSGRNCLLTLAYGEGIATWEYHLYSMNLCDWNFADSKK
jgi:hypothetical protein